MKKTFTLLSSLVFSLLSITASGQENEWKQIDDIIPAAFNNSSVAYENKVYFTGGVTTQFVTVAPYNDNLHILDLETEKITKAEGKLSKARCAISCAALDGKVYFAGGYKYTNGNAGIVYDEVDVYDVATGNWDTLYLSAPRGFMATAVVGGKIMFAGGFTVINSQEVASDIVDIYDPKNGGSWSVAHLSQARGDFRAGVIGDKVWFCGGDKDYYDTTTRVDIYDDTNSGSWSTAELSLKRSGLSVATAGKYLLVAGGVTGLSQTVGNSDRVDIFNTETGQQSTATLSEPRSYMAAATVGDKAFFTGGGNFNISTGFLDYSTTAVDIFDASDSSWTTNNLNIDRIAHTCAAWGDSIVVGGGWDSNGGTTGQTTWTVEVLDINDLVATNGGFIEPIISIFPNPTSNQITIEFPYDFQLSKSAQLTLSDVTGKICCQMPLRKTIESLDASHLQAGVYFINIQNEGRIFSKKVIVQ